MAVESGASHPLVFVRNETKPYVFIYRPRDRTLAPFVITGQSVVMQIIVNGEVLHTYTDLNPGCYISNGAAGEITVNPTAEMKTAYAFQNARYVITLQGKRLFYGPLTVKYLYE
ncbi:MAG: hypothetical protein ABL959_09545 [Pyrinomonadaceae bacterium]